MNIKEQEFQENCKLAVDEYYSAYQLLVDENRFTSQNHDDISHALDHQVKTLADRYGFNFQMSVWMDTPNAQIISEIMPLFSKTVVALNLDVDSFEYRNIPDRFFFESEEDAAMFNMMMSDHGLVSEL